MNPPDSSPRTVKAGFLAVAVVLAGIINFAYSIAMTHGLSRPDYSVFAAGQSLLLVSGTLAVAAIPWVLAQELVVAAGDTRRRRAAVQFALEVNFLGALVAAATVGLFSLTFAVWPTTGVLALGAFLLVVGSTGAGYLQGDGRMTAVAAIGLAEFLTKAGFGVIAVFLLGAGLNSALGAAAVGAALLTAIGLFYMRGDISWSRPRSTSAHLWQSAARIGLLQVMVALISAADTIMAAALTETQASAASYQVASTLGRIPFFFSVALSTAAFPLIVRNPHDRHARVVALRAYCSLSIFFIIALVTMPAGILSALLPRGYSDLRALLPYTAVLGISLGLLNLLTTFIQAQLRVRECLLLLVNGFVLHIAAMYAGARLDGVRGLAIAAGAASAITVATVAMLPSENSAVRTAVSLRRPLMAVGLGLLLVPLIFLRTLDVWLPWAVVVGIIVTVTSFPELQGKTSVGVFLSRRPGG